MNHPIRNLSKIIVTATFALASLVGMVAAQTAPASAQPYYHHGPGYAAYSWHGHRYHHRRWHPGFYGPAHRWHAGFWVYF